MNPETTVGQVAQQDPKYLAYFTSRDEYMAQQMARFQTYNKGALRVTKPFFSGLVAKLRKFHKSHGKLATLTAVRPPARFGHLQLEGDQITEFTEKPQIGEGWINGAFFVLEPKVFDYIDEDSTHWEKEPLERLAADGQLMAYKHNSFWQCMDTIREKKLLEGLWESGKAPWKTWED